MIVTIRRSGGFANISRTYTIDSAKLDPSERETLERALAALADANDRQHPDTYRYTIECEGKAYTIAEGWIAKRLIELAE